MTELYQDIVALITDFGSRGEHYVASMKAVLLKINPNVKIIDLSHQVSSYSIIEASYLINSTLTFFPEYSIFIIVIDPGVGSSRNILAIKTKNNYYFVGPDNGIFFNILSEAEIEECINVKNDNYFNNPVSKTFHGRDIMAPIGAHISNGVPLTNFGPIFDPKDFVKYPITHELLPEKGKIKCTIQYIDSFGNATTNISIKHDIMENRSFTLVEDKKIKFLLENKEYEGFFKSHFAKVPKKSLLFLEGSSGYLEISINQGNASEQIGFKVGDIITFILN
ncbi:MAG: hypothetical protein EU539_02315 [Promethearchaeota archaeon]|nr:MAG: hypothetical protein EU539_02315 [Candidatus Lokiarchaeota archaeon]